ncbi:MAG: FAD-dependent oxidoreductase, partial [Ruminococcaceae bacterium]|nr:FAD-dependent oxidoreductase [Oscillospiraceae bacterium]
NGYDLRPLGASDIPDDQKTETNQVKTLINRRFTGLDGDEISEIVMLSHDATLKDIIKKRENDPSVLPTTITTIPQLRMTRKIVGEYTLHDTEQHKYFEDSIGMVCNWWIRGPIYEVPFRSLYSKEVKNLITAGRSVSVQQNMWEVMRVIPCCAVTGQAAGTAAALTDDFTTLDVSLLQEKLSDAGVVLHEKDIL